MLTVSLVWVIQESFRQGFLRKRFLSVVMVSSVSMYWVPTFDSTYKSSQAQKYSFSLCPWRGGPSSACQRASERGGRRPPRRDLPHGQDEQGECRWLATPHRFWSSPWECDGVIESPRGSSALMINGNIHQQRQRIHHKVLRFDKSYWSAVLLFLAAVGVILTHLVSLSRICVKHLNPY